MENIICNKLVKNWDKIRTTLALDHFEYQNVQVLFLPGKLGKLCDFVNNHNQIISYARVVNKSVGNSTSHFHDESNIKK